MSGRDCREHYHDEVATAIDDAADDLAVRMHDGILERMLTETVSLIARLPNDHHAGRDIPYSAAAG